MGDYSAVDKPLLSKASSFAIRSHSEKNYGEAVLANISSTGTPKAFQLAKKRKNPFESSKAPSRSWDIPAPSFSQKLPGNQRPTANSSPFGNIAASGNSIDLAGASSRLKAQMDLETASKDKEIELSSEQRKVFDLVVTNRKSVFYTGKAGTGKSLLLRKMIFAFKDKFGASNTGRVAITAPTGKAACNIGGCTIHSFAGIGLGIEPAHILIKKIEKLKNVKARWLSTHVLFIDEVSMLDGELLDKLDQIARTIRKVPNKPFGGIQLVLTGDFFQLPPIGKTVKFAFESKSWPTLISHSIQLSQIFRQSDPTFINLLNELRMGRMSPANERILLQLARTPAYPQDGIEATQLYSRRDQVERANQSHLDALPGPIIKYTATDWGHSESHLTRIKKDCNAPEVLEVKIGAQVMLIKNLSEVLVNGSVGIITEFTDVKEGGGRSYPVVSFENGMKLPIVPTDWSLEVPGLGLMASRNQVPLLLAWAISIHKSQGQTLTRVKVDLGSIFECGQAYVALSRATSLQGLQVLNFRPSIIKVNPKVVSFAKLLEALPF